MLPAVQIVQELSRNPKLIACRAQIDTERIVRDAITIQQIPAPTFAEKKRALYLKERFQKAGLQAVTSDEVHNVYGCWPGKHADHPALMVSAHTDTVFPAETDLTVRREGNLVYGPGLGDNSLGVAALLALLDLIKTQVLQPECDVWFVANSREEGLGNLDGIRAMWHTLSDRLGAAIVVEGMALGHIYHGGIAVRRLHVMCKAPGGHSWLHYGRPSATHGLVDFGARILAIDPPTIPRTTYNIGLISGGHSINSLAMEADLYLDMRSEDSTALAKLERQVRAAIDAVKKTGVEFMVDVVGDRPSGQIPTDHPLVQLATAALESANLRPVYETGSTDANVLLANNLPTVTIGISNGSNAHRLDEYIEAEPIAAGLWQFLLLTLATCQQLAEW